MIVGGPTPQSEDGAMMQIATCLVMLIDAQ